MKLGWTHGAVRALAIAAGVGSLAASASAQRYIQHNLVSDVPSLAPRTDPNLVNRVGHRAQPRGPHLDRQ